jgi:tyrosine-specific transport protein
VLLKGQTMENRASRLQILSIGFLIVGNLIGAGILALPINTGLSGFFPSLAGLVLTSAAMFYSSIILSREAVERKQSTFNYPSLYQNYLGAGGKWIAVVANLIILYGLLTAYLTGITTIVSSLFDLSVSPVWIMLGFFVFVTAISMAGIEKIQKYIAVLVVVKCAIFLVIAFMAGGHIKTENLSHVNWALFTCGIPILVTAFHFHNIIPAVCETLKWDSRTIQRTMFIGMAMGFVMNASWLFVSIGVIPLDDSPFGLVTAFTKNLPATIPLSEIMGSQIFLLLAMFFAMIAITTAYLANGMGLIGFMDDITINNFGIKSPLLSRVLAFGPPLLISLVYPDLFLKAIDIAGGFGIVTLFGILPSIIAIRKATTPVQRALGFAMLALFGLFFALETAQEFGLLQISPETEYWK